MICLIHTHNMPHTSGRFNRRATGHPLQRPLIPTNKIYVCMYVYTNMLIFHRSGHSQNLTHMCTRICTRAHARARTHIYAHAYAHTHSLSHVHPGTHMREASNNSRKWIRILWCQTTSTSAFATYNTTTEDRGR